MKKIFPVVLLILFISFKVFAQAQSDEYIKDKNSGCLVKNSNGSPDLSVEWTGSCKDGYAEGEGKLTWFEHDKIVAEYIGTLEKGVANGKGKYIFPGWGTMEGNFVNDVLQGQGKMIMENGGKLEGNFVDGNLLELDRPYLEKLQKIDTGITDVSGIYQGGTSKSLFYYVLPPQGKISGVAAIFPSSSESAENVISSNKEFIQKCYDKNILSVVVAANYNNGLEIDTLAMKYFNYVFTDVIKKYNAPEDKFVLYGLSLGGNNALHYTEFSRSKKIYTSIVPAGVIGLDPPVDASALYRKAEDEINLYTNSKMEITPGKQMALDENHFLLDYYTKSYGGPPDKFPQKYVEASQFSRSEKDGGNAKYLLNVPVRIYCDPDIEWQMKNRNRDFYHMNAADLSAMINFLIVNGNDKAEFISALGKGYRLDGTRHPHSWSIADADGCVEWILKLIN